MCNNNGTWAVVSLRPVIKPARSTALLRPYNFSGYVEDKSVNPPTPQRSVSSVTAPIVRPRGAAFRQERTSFGPCSSRAGSRVGCKYKEMNDVYIF